MACGKAHAAHGHSPAHHANTTHKARVGAASLAEGDPGGGVLLCPLR